MAFALVTLALTIAVPIAAIILESAHIPDVVLGTKAINAGPSGTKTLTFGLLTSPNDAVLAAAYISIAAGVICACGIAFVRHIPRYSFVLGCVMITAALGNFLAQIGCTVCWAVWQGKRDGKTAAPGEVSYVDGNYETGGRLFTREAWACTMEKYFGEREGSWASKACSDLVSCFVPILSD